MPYETDDYLSRHYQTTGIDLVHRDDAVAGPVVDQLLEWVAARIARWPASLIAGMEIVKTLFRKFEQPFVDLLSESGHQAQIRLPFLLEQIQ